MIGEFVESWQLSQRIRRVSAAPRTPEQAMRWQDAIWRSVVVLAQLCPLSCAASRPQSARTPGQLQTRAANTYRGSEYVTAAHLDSGERRFQTPDRPVVALGQLVESEVFETSPGAAGITLRDMIRLARDSNPDFQAAAHRTRLADAILSQARAEFYPRLGIAENYAVSNNPSTTFMFSLDQGRLDLSHFSPIPETVDDFHSQLYLHQGLYSGGRRTARVRSAEAERDATMHSLSAVQNELTFHVAEAYYRLSQASQLVDVRAEAVQQVEGHLELVKARFECGAAVKSEVLAVEVRLAEVREALISAKNQLQLAWAVLENVVGSTIPRQEMIDRTGDAPWSDHIMSLEAALTEAIERRPETAASADRCRSAEQQVKAAQSGRYPTVDLVSDYDIHSGDLARGNDSFFVGIAMRFDLFNGGRTESQVCEAMARLRELEAQRARVLMDIKLEVQQAYVQLEDAKQRVLVSEQAVAQNEENLRETEARYKIKSAIITQLIDAQVNLSNARVRYANAAAEVEISRAALERAVGHLTNELTH